MSEFERQKADRADPMFFGPDAANEFIQTLVTIVGPEYGCEHEEEFCKRTGCPPERLEGWLREEWTLHNAQKVARLEEKPGRWPLILVSKSGNVFYRSGCSRQSRSSCLIRPKNRRFGVSKGKRLESLIDRTRVDGGLR